MFIHRNAKVCKSKKHERMQRATCFESNMRPIFAKMESRYMGNYAFIGQNEPLKGFMQLPPKSNKYAEMARTQYC